MSQSNLDAALAYAGRGWHVFPVGPWDPDGDPSQPKKTPARDAYDRAKRPLSQFPGGATCCDGTHAHAKDDATIDAALIRRWWAAHPDARVGYHAQRSGLAIVDDDSYGAPNPQKEGRAPLPEPRPSTLTVLTPSDGRQELFHAPPGCTDSNFRNGEVLHNRYGILPSPGSGYRFEDSDRAVASVEEPELEARLFFGGASASYEGPAPDDTALGARRDELVAFLGEAGIAGYKIAIRPNGGIFAALDVCPFGEHGDSRSAWVGRHPSGAWVAGCHHNGCGGQGSENRWTELRAQVYGTAELETFSVGEFSWRPVVPEMPTRVKLSDLVLLPVPPIHWVVSGMIPDGLTLLAGPPKLGKSWFVLDLAIQVASGEDFLGRGSSRGDVLYLALEDNLRRLKSRALTVLGHRDAPDRLELWTRAGKLTTTLLPDIEDWLDMQPDPQLVIIDTLGRVQEHSAWAGDSKDGGYAEAIDALAGLQDLASARGVAVVIITHTKKGGWTKDSDPLEAVLGSQGYAGTADSILVMGRARGDSDGQLFVTGREIAEEVVTSITFDRETCRWTEGAGEYETLEDQLLDLLERRDKRGDLDGAWTMTAEQIAHEIKRRESDVKVALEALESCGKATSKPRPGRGRPGKLWGPAVQLPPELAR